MNAGLIDYCGFLIAQEEIWISRLCCTIPSRGAAMSGNLMHPPAV
jgi:hypothetical protein